jgi:hypothetical protein
MTMCLSNETLVVVRLGDASPDDTRHATDCALCASRLASMRTDLARIDAILAVAPPRRVARPARGSIAVRLAPFAVAAAAALVLLVARGEHPVGAPAHAPVSVAAVADEVSGAFAPVDDDDGDDTDENDDDGSDDDTTWAASTCALDEPFIGIGCDNGVQLTALAW